MFNRLSEDNFRKLKLPRESSLVNFSSFRELKTDVLFRSFSLKFVTEGCEQYLIDGNLFKVSKGEFLVGNHFSNGKLLIQSDKEVKGLCIDIAPEIMSDVANGFRCPEITEQDPELVTFFTSESFVENKSHFSNNNIGRQLLQISGQISYQTDHQFEFNKEFYYLLAENLVSVYAPDFYKVQKLNVSKIQTRKLLYRKMLAARNYIDEHFISIENIEEVARASSVSEYHFFRLFRQLFNESPYQYITRKKLNPALQLLKDKGFSLTDIAVACGFADLSSFSKSFKKQFGVSPRGFTA